MTGARKWEDQAWPALRDLAQRGDGEVGLVPVGATEQHGPHLPTGTDTIIATAVCDLASEATGAPVLPAIPVACSYGHGTLMPGTLSLTPNLLGRRVRAHPAAVRERPLRQRRVTRDGDGPPSAVPT
jgi:creatinine amidohydrolase/Fe(II)-dependent formamide hydrolase-like protein